MHTDLTLSGAVAQYGRGVGMIQATASALMNQFANNLKKQLANPADPAAADTAVKPISATSLAGQVVWNSIKDKLGRKVLGMAGSADNDPVILVDADDVQVGTAGKLDAHQRGLRHRAISVLVRNSAGRIPAAAAKPGQISLRRIVDQRLLQPSAARRKRG